MAQLAKALLQIDITGSSLFITDKTGENATGNEGGYGSPVEDLANLALVGYAQRTDEEGDVTPMVPVSGQVIYNNAADNTDETEFEFTLLEDGHIKAGFFVLPVTLDGTNYQGGGGTIQEGDYYYQNGIIYHYESATPVEVTDYSSLIDDVGVVQVICEDLVVPKLSIEKGKLYQKYKDYRDSQCVQEAIDEFEKIKNLQFDLQGADYDYRSGLISESRKTIKALIDEYL